MLFKKFFPPQTWHTVAVCNGFRLNIFVECFSFQCLVNCYVQNLICFLQTQKFEDGKILFIAFTSNFFFVLNHCVNFVLTHSQGLKSVQHTSNELAS